MASFKSRVIALCAAGTIALGGTVISVPTSFAQGADDQIGQGQPVENVPAQDDSARPVGAPRLPGQGENALPTANEVDLLREGQTGTLTINKILGDPERNAKGETHTGPSIGGESSEPLGGTTFTIQRLNFDLTKLDGWKKLNDLAKSNSLISDAEGVKVAGSEQSKTTPEEGNKKGQVEFANLPIGVYLVTEQPRAGFSNSAPFLVSLPYSDGASGKWIYTRTVHPKNQKLAPNKQVDAQGVTLGGNLPYTINAPVPAGRLSELKITDELVDNLRLVTTDEDGPVVSTSAGTELTRGAQGDYSLGTANNTLTVEFTEQGLRKLEAARENNPNLQVHVNFKATVVSLPENGAPITNTARVKYPNRPEITTNSPAQDPEEPGAPTSTTYANLQIRKYTEDQAENLSLTGAKFELYRCENKELFGDPTPVSTTQTLDNPENDIVSTLITGETTRDDNNQYQSFFEGYGIPIKVSAAGIPDEEYDYCAIETQAPAGFIRNPEVHKVTKKEITEGQAERWVFEVENQRENFLSSLPATGAWGIILVFLVGLGLLARGFYTSRKDGRATA
ncbi:SpaH/EbpB family LPXTG-anchored major pilin [Corynebacterium sp.]|uniref:SpaH/EbpB family LPXTG-anchored major pilin n=1 Tax=Corynebacterium sp. TaxID=1720 RepID=UPI0027BA0144|nr:SpaH/EbpB family LPXTG-anchored major pilin [Corynebacterium sp.]